MKAATLPDATAFCTNFISIHAAREGGDADRLSKGKNAEISIHAAREGGDASCFLPSPPTKISIHAAREGGDSDSGE